MIKHIVIWRLKEEAHGISKIENARLLKEKLEALNGKIPGLIKLEVGFDFSHTDTSSDVALYSEFESKEALKAYQDHPLHKAVVLFLKEVRLEKRVVDYEG